MRDPIAVTAVFITANSVLLSPPIMLRSISRLRLVAASSTTLSSLRSGDSDVIWGRLERWVSFTYWSRQPAAQIPKGWSWQPKPARLRVPN